MQSHVAPPTCSCFDGGLDGHNPRVHLKPADISKGPSWADMHGPAGPSRTNVGAEQ